MASAGIPMDPRLLGYYNQELKFLREMGAEFAAAYPRIASRLGLAGDAECADPYVERLLEGFAFLAARTQLKLEARHPQFTQHLLEMIYPDYLSPVPSCAIAQFVPDLSEGSLKAGVRISRGTTLRTPLVKGEHTACEFRTAQEVTVWPLVVSEARYIAGAGALGTLGVTGVPAARAAMRLRLKTVGGIALAALPLDRLLLFIHGAPDLAARIHEQVSANALGYALRALPAPGGGSSSGALQRRGASAIEALGFGETEALLPAIRPCFEGYRLLQEYFALPERYLFFALAELAGPLQSCQAEECELFVLLDRADPALESQLDAAQFRLGCTPIINLFARDIDRLHLNAFETEQHLVVDRNRPQDYEIYRLEQVSGIGGARGAPVPIRPFYSLDHDSGAGPSLYYTVQRRARVASQPLQNGARSHYVGSECYLSMSGVGSEQFVQLDARALCTNRDLPMHLSAGTHSELLVEGGAPVASVRCIVGPTRPKPSAAFGDTSWKLISHLSLNYLSLLDGSGTEGAALLRDLLLLHADGTDPAVRRQVEGVRSVGYEPVVRRLPIPGPISHGRGLRITLQMDEAAFEGTGVMRLASVLERFFAAYVSINAFTQTRVLALSRGEIKEWLPRIGQRPLM